MAKHSVIKTAPEKFKADQIWTYLILLPVIVIMLLPVLYVLFHAFKPMDELFAYPPRFITLRPTLDNFKRLFAMADTSNWPVTLYIFNSLVSTVCSFVPVAVAVPRFLIIKQLGLMNSFWSQILPLLAMPVGLFLVQQFIDQLPNSLLEAAQIDGCSDYGILFRIVIPIIKPALATVAILAFQSAWSSVEASQMFINSEKIKTFAYYMSAVTSPTGNTVDGQAMAAAAAVIMFVPNVVLFVLMQSKAMNTVAHSGIK